jgi:hypothetical protein
MKLKVSRNGQSGAGLVLAAFFSLVILMIAAIGLGLGFVITNKSRVQNVANLVALSALELAVRDGSDNKVLTQADSIIAANKIPGIANWSSFSVPIEQNGGGRIIFGNWYYEDPDGPDGPTNPCEVHGAYPCFIPEDGYKPGVNAVRVVMQGNNLTNRVIAPFANIFGSSAKAVSAQALAVIAGQCSAVLMDVSRSVTYDTHKPKGITLIPNQTVSQFIYDNNIGEDPQDPRCPGNPAVSSSSLCQLKPLRDPSFDIYSTEKYQSDYKITRARQNKDVMVDRFVEGAGNGHKYYGPQPMTDLFMGVNAGLRYLYESSKGSMWRGIGFAGLSADTLVTPNPVPLIGFAGDPGVLIHVTNLENRGTNDIVRTMVSPTVGASFLSHGWYAPPFPIDPSTFESDENPGLERTNFVEAIEKAIGWFEGKDLNGGVACPVNYKKILYVATDGMMNCSKTAASPPYKCQNNYTGYSAARAQLLNMLSVELQRKKIQVVSIVGGAAVEPNFINRKAPAGYTTSIGSMYLSAQEALASGYGAFRQSDPNLKMISEEPGFDAPSFQTWCATVYGNGSPCSANPPIAWVNDYVMQKAGQDRVVFREPVSVMAQLAIDTGGQYCPVMPLHPSNGAYSTNPSGKVVISDFYRGDGRIQKYTIEKKTPSEQVLECFKNTWTNKFILVERDSLPENLGAGMLLP